MSLPILGLDFDGVLHSYASGWQGPGIINDPPVVGAMAFIIEALKHFTVAIYSSRSAHLGGLHAMQWWLKEALISDLGYDDFTARKLAYEIIEWPESKPPAFVSLDDRCMLFNGIFPDMEELLAFKPWNKA